MHRCLDVFRRHHGLRAAVSLLLATGLWISVLHLFFAPDLTQYRQKGGVAPRARMMAERHLQMWSDPQLRAAEINRMRQSNAEWDFMGRTFLVLAFCNMALHEPERQAEYLVVIDRIIDETLRLERQNGMYFFLMNYARRKAWVEHPARSVFVDGEIALMLAARRIVAEKPTYRRALAERITQLQQQMRQSPVMCGESYPDECWLFCNSIAVAAIQISDALGDADQQPFVRKWLQTIRRDLVHAETGLLVSSFTVRGDLMDGPEGSSIWMIAHCLQIIDAPFAEDQYARARRELRRCIAGFGYATEWPNSWQGPIDIDSGPIVPVVGASAGSSGLAVLGAAAFDDDAYLREMITTLNFAGFPEKDGDWVRYAASNQVGDAVLLYALVQGPLWQRVESLKKDSP